MQSPWLRLRRDSAQRPVEKTNTFAPRQQRVSEMKRIALPACRMPHRGMLVKATHLSPRRQRVSEMRRSSQPTGTQATRARAGDRNGNVGARPMCSSHCIGEHCSSSNRVGCMADAIKGEMHQRAADGASRTLHALARLVVELRYCGGPCYSSG